VAKMKENCFKTKYRHAGILLNVNAAIYFKFKLQLKFRNNENYASIIVNSIHIYAKRHTELKLNFLVARQPVVGQGLLIVEASRSHSDTPHWVGLLWTSDQPVAETST
jgi:hypothetical protein